MMIFILRKHYVIPLLANSANTIGYLKERACGHQEIEALIKILNFDLMFSS